MGRDWTASPYIDLDVVDEHYCPQGWESTYERFYYGTKVGCDCLNVGYYDYYFYTGEVCDSNQTAYGCITARPVIPVRMSRMDGKLICGLPTSEAYLQQSRPGIDGKCSQGLLPCLPGKSVDPEIQNCVDDMKKCPITDIQILSKKEAKPYRKSGEYT